MVYENSFASVADVASAEYVAAIIQVAERAIGEHTNCPAFQKTLQKFPSPWDRRTESLPDYLIEGRLNVAASDSQTWRFHCSPMPILRQET